MIAATCPPSKGYVSNLCLTHPPFHPSSHLALTGLSVNPGQVLAIALALSLVGAVVLAVTVRKGRNAE